MIDPVDVSIVISTYNRCGLLGDALRSVIAQQPGGPSFELIVVDNNSKDATREVVEAAMREAGDVVSYVFEGKQGLSHGRNAGIARARAPIVAFTDDDVRASPVWVREIKRAFDAHPDVDWVGGKVLPLWPSEPPAWLTPLNWSPLAIVDYGDRELRLDASNPRCVVGANMAFRREVFGTFGVYDPAYQHKPGAVSAVEDHEFEMRLLRAGRVGLYVPSIVTHADVQPNRLEKWYHRKWFADHGRAIVDLLGPEEYFGPTGMPVVSPPGALHFLGTPAWMYRALAVETLRLGRAMLLRRESEALRYQCNTREWLGQLHSRRVRHGFTTPRALPGELTRFARGVTRRLAARPPKAE